MKSPLPAMAQDQKPKCKIDGRNCVVFIAVIVAHFSQVTNPSHWIYPKHYNSYCWAPANGLGTRLTLVSRIALCPFLGLVGSTNTYPSLRLEMDFVNSVHILTL